MKVDSVFFQGHRCFREWAGFDQIKPINAVIGKNNTGKSHLLDLVEKLSSGMWKGSGWKFQCTGTLDEATLRKQFHEGSGGGRLEGEEWQDHGKHFVGAKIRWHVDSNGSTCDL